MYQFVSPRSPASRFDATLYPREVVVQGLTFCKYGRWHCISFFTLTMDICICVILLKLLGLITACKSFPLRKQDSEKKAIASHGSCFEHERSFTCMDSSGASTSKLTPRQRPVTSILHTTSLLSTYGTMKQGEKSILFVTLPPHRPYLQQRRPRTHLLLLRLRIFPLAHR